MFNKERVLAIVPARCGSKRLPNKNIASVAGKPLLAWSLRAAIGSQFVDHIILSTDDDSIGDIGRGCGYPEVLMRPKPLGVDDAPMTLVIEHVIRALSERGQEFGYIILLQPTSPLRTARHIDEAFSTINAHNAIGAVSVCQTEHPLEWMGKLSEDGSLDRFFQETKLEHQSQTFSPGYQINGAIYIVPVRQFLKEKTLFISIGMVAYTMERKDSVDIDDSFDLSLANWLLSQSQ